MNPNSEHIDILTELINIGIGRGASLLNTMLHRPIQLTVPSVKIINSEDLGSIAGNFKLTKISGVKLPFRKDFNGQAQIVFPTEGIPVLISALLGEESNSDNSYSLRMGTLSEIGNIVLNSVIGTISNLLNVQLEYSIPTYFELMYNELFEKNTDDRETVYILAETHFIIESIEVEGDIILIFEMNSFNQLVEHLDKLN